MLRARIILLLCITALCLFLQASAAQAQTPSAQCGQLTSIISASLTPNQGVAGSSVLVTGQVSSPVAVPGADAPVANTAATYVNISWGDSGLTSSAIDQNGNFSGAIGVPTTAPAGNNTVKLLAQGDPDAYCLNFTVLSVQQQAYSTSLPATGSMPALPLAGLLFGAGGAVLYRRLRGRGNHQA